MPWILRGLREGVVTTRYPRHPDPYADQWPGTVDVLRTDLTDVDGTPESLCPTAAITRNGQALQLDQGRCILCRRCVRERPDLFALRAGAQTARSTRRALYVPDPPEDEAALAALRADLAARTRALRRSVHLRHVDAGSDGSEEWEVMALLNPVYDIHRLGIFFTASPRHADIALVTGTGTHGMTEPMARTLDAMPRSPRGPGRRHRRHSAAAWSPPTYATDRGIGGQLPVDVWVPGSPPSPFSILHGLLLLLNRLPQTDRPGGVR
ncbi:NADH:ubiquinone oxidoreductase [Streptacidiphilus sp. 4-A2]|nr:NADH:ubiquinone oxidoreductase [Streptacidiphilus sp. 4-A2]